MKRPVLQGSQVEIIRSGQFYTLLLGKHISISWDKGTRLLVHILATYRVLMHCNIKFILKETTFYSSHIFFVKDLQSIFLLHTFFVSRAVYVVCVVTLMEMSTMT